MRSFPPIPAVTAVVTAIAFLGLAGAALAAGEAERPLGGQPQPPQRTEERPFGGPPPSKRSMQPVNDGKTCRTAVGTCRLESAKPAGSDCSCPGSAGQGPGGKVE